MILMARRANVLYLPYHHLPIYMYLLVDELNSSTHRPSEMEDPQCQSMKHYDMDESPQVSGRPLHNGVSSILVILDPSKFLSQLYNRTCMSVPLHVMTDDL